jgi:predicted nucleic acid-binding Zn ribbon protein
MPIYDYKCLDCSERFEALILKNTRDNNARGVRAKNAAATKEYQIEQIKHEREHHH